MRSIREYRKMCRSEGFDLLRVEMGGKHCRLVFEVGFVTAACTPSDHRNLTNVRGAIRRLHS